MSYVRNRAQEIPIYIYAPFNYTIHAYDRTHLFIHCRNFDILLFHSDILFIAGEPGGAGTRVGASAAGGTYRGSTRSSDDHKVATADQQGIFCVIFIGR